MSRARTLVTTAAALLVAVAACDESQQPLEPIDGADPATAHSGSHGQLDGTEVACQPAGTGLTAVVVNEDVIDREIDVGDCDVGVYFDEDGVVDGAVITQTDDNPDPTVQHGLRVDGADVQVTGTEVEVVDDFVHQFVAVGFRDGATGRIADNTITGFHRTGILLDGAGTSAEVIGNEVIGVGPRSSGWAENGVQISRGATGTVKDNVVRDHWWDLNNFVSSGILVFETGDVTVQRNTLSGNDAAIALQGDRNNVIHNTVDATDEDGAASGIFHAGAIVFAGTDNGLRQNELTSGSPPGSASFGIFVTGAATNTKLIRNTFDGFAVDLVDQGDETKLPDPFVP
jgi:parallel beta-helix repeat protein